MSNSKKITDGRVTITFRGVEFEVSEKAWKSVKVQKAISAPKKSSDVYWGLDMLCLGKSDEYMMKMPNADGEVDTELGADEDTVIEFIKEISKAVGKN